jgi:hypothetical protein
MRNPGMRQSGMLDRAGGIGPEPTLTTGMTTTFFFTPLRMMAGVEALNGLLLLGWSACYVHAALDGISTSIPRAGRRCTRRRAR